MHRSTLRTVPNMDSSLIWHGELFALHILYTMNGEYYSGYHINFLTWVNLWLGNLLTLPETQSHWILGNILWSRTVLCHTKSNFNEVTFNGSGLPFSIRLSMHEPICWLHLNQIQCKIFWCCYWIWGKESHSRKWALEVSCVQEKYAIWQEGEAENIKTPPTTNTSNCNRSGHASTHESLTPEPAYSNKTHSQDTPPANFACKNMFISVSWAMKPEFYNGLLWEYRPIIEYNPHLDNLMLTYENEQVHSTQPYANKDQNAGLLSRLKTKRKHINYCFYIYSVLECTKRQLHLLNTDNKGL